MSATLNTKIKLRNDTLANWQTYNPVLEEGEAAVVFDGTKVRIKFGNARTAFNDLPYADDYTEEFDAKQDKLVAGTNIAIADDGKTISAKNQNNAYNYINQIADYLFEVQYSTESIDYDYANKYFKKYPPVKSAPRGWVCTGVYNDQKVLRQLDWYYDDNVEFIVRRPADEVRGFHSSIGIASGIKDMTKENVESRLYNEKYQMVPFIMTDGINDAGLYVQSNVVPPLDDGFDINPTAPEECCITMAARYMLDHCANFADVENFFNTVHIYGTSTVTYGYHFLIAQGDEWEIIELTSDGHKTVTAGTGENQMPHGIMTNFRTTGLTFTDDNVDWGSIEQYGLGVERYDAATKVFTEGESFENLRTDLKFTNLYTNLQTNTRWNTDLCGEKDDSGVKLTVMDAKNNPEKFDSIFTKEAAAYAQRDRKAADPDTWQTVHSAIYDLSKKSINVAIQERFDETFDFYLDQLIDLSGYRTAAAQDIIDETKQTKLVAGDNIAIADDGKTISAVDTKYTVTIDV